MEKYEAILNCINNELKNNEDTIKYLREKKAELEKENAELKEANAKLEKENDELKLALMN